MKDKSYVISREASNDIAKIWEYTFKNWSLAQADRYFRLIMDEIEFVSKNFDSGKLAEPVKVGYRVSKMKSHLIFYRKLDETENSKIKIIRVLHERMDVESKLGTE